MAGSLKWFIYTTDTGNNMGHFMDEDWGELMGNTDVTTDPSGLYGIPMNLEPRYALYRSNSGARQLKVVVGDNTATSDTLPQTITVDATNGEVSEQATDNTFYLSTLIGERYRPVIAVDTGLIDGDAT
ncbi:MAG: hypothetical protein VKK42_25960 [Lyngbya sp.]|nr:hypothetical protein [Lyngbya sp.]